MRAEGMDVVFYCGGNRLAVMWQDKYTVPNKGDFVKYMDKVYTVVEIVTAIYRTNKPDIEIHIERVNDGF